MLYLDLEVEVVHLHRINLHVLLLSIFFVSGAPLENGVFAAAGRDTLCRRRRRRAAVGAPAYRGAKGAACYPRGWARAVSKTHAPADRRDVSTTSVRSQWVWSGGSPLGFRQGLSACHPPLMPSLVLFTSYGGCPLDPIAGHQAPSHSAWRTMASPPPSPPHWRRHLGCASKPLRAPRRPPLRRWQSVAVVPAATAVRRGLPLCPRARPRFGPVPRTWPLTRCMAPSWPPHRVPRRRWHTGGATRPSRVATRWRSPGCVGGAVTRTLWVAASHRRRQGDRYGPPLLATGRQRGWVAVVGGWRRPGGGTPAPRGVCVRPS